MAWDANACKHRRCPKGHEWACTSKKCPECNEYGDTVCKDRTCEKCDHTWNCYLVNCPACGHEDPIKAAALEEEEGKEDAG